MRLRSAPGSQLRSEGTPSANSLLRSGQISGFGVHERRHSSCERLTTLAGHFSLHSLVDCTAGTGTKFLDVLIKESERSSEFGMYEERDLVELRMIHYAMRKLSGCINLHFDHETLV